MNATSHGRDVSSERDSARKPGHGRPAPRVRASAVERLSATGKTIQERQVPLSGSPAKGISEKKPQSHHFLLLWTFAGVRAGAFLFNLM